MSYELYLPPEKPTRSRTTGRFLKGHVPHNQGVEGWQKSLPKRTQRRIAKGWENVVKYRPEHRSENAGRSRIKCVAVTKDGKFKIFDHIGEAAEWSNGNRVNIRRCCKCNSAQHVNRKTHKINTDHEYMGYRWYYFDDPQWWDKVGEQE